ncbi:MAG: hypothetical protein AAB646_00445 [Patescibacteria group bacterium]
MKFYPVFCVESGDLFSFVGGKNEQDAAKWFVARILGIKGATLGETVVVREDYRGKKLSEFATENLILLWPGLADVRFRKEGGRLYFTKVPIPRRSRFEAWQGVFRKGESMMRLKKCHWIARGLTKNPVIGVLP